MILAKVGKATDGDQVAGDVALHPDDIRGLQAADKQTVIVFRNGDTIVVDQRLEYVEQQINRAMGDGS